MKKELKEFFEKIIKISFLVFVFLLPWQTKLILRPAGNNFNEISFYFSHLFLIISLILFLIYQLLKKEYQEKGLFIWYCLSGLLLVIFLSFFFAPDKVLAFYKYIIILLGVFLFYFLQQVFRQPIYGEAIMEKTRVIFIFLSSIFLHVCLGVYQFLNQKSFAFKYLGLASHHPEDLGVSVVETLSGRWLRAYGGFDHPNIFGGVLAISIILASYLLAKKKLIRTNKEIFESIFLFVFYFFSLLALLFTFSRSAWLALALGFICLFIVFLIRKEKWALGRLAMLFFFSLFLTSIIYFSYQDLFSTRIINGGRLESMSANERSMQFNEFKEIIAEKWFFGTGIGNYTNVLTNNDYLENNLKKADWEYQPVHNSFLLLWSESGFMALIFLLAFFISVWKRGYRDGFAWFLLSPLIILMLFDHWFFSLPFGIIFLFFILGLL